jgi:SAM-dependent methyltransferase
VRCAKCDFNGATIDGFLDLVHGDRFDDNPDEECLCYEEDSNEFTAREFWVPVFRRLFADVGYKPRLLAVGCGTGVEVDLLHGAGFETAGVEIGNRTAAWPRREASKWLMMANGKSLPFPDDTFDAAFCGCVFPHVGVEGDSFKVTVSCQSDRLELAKEMQRVVKPDGYVIASSPNRYFPFDIFHGREAGSYKPRVNRPGDRFLLSVRDYSRMFADAGLTEPRALPSSGYWGFVRSANSLKGRLLGMPVRALFWITSELKPLRGSVLAPWIVVCGRKASS